MLSAVPSAQSAREGWLYCPLARHVLSTHGTLGVRINQMFRGSLLRLVIALCASLPLVTLSWAAHINTHGPTKSKSQKISESAHTRRRYHHLARSRSATVHSASLTRRRHYYETFNRSSFAEDITSGDVTAGEDGIVREAAIDALGNMNGTVVAIEPTSGRILAMVNQKLAL